MSHSIEEFEDDLEAVLVGRRIVSAEEVMGAWRTGREYNPRAPYLKLTLDNGAVVEVEDSSECCAWAEVSSFFLDPASVDHVITSVTSNEGYTEFFVLADMNQVLKLNTSWSEGSGYYSYGLTVRLVK